MTGTRDTGHDVAVFVVLWLHSAVRLLPRDWWHASAGVALSLAGCAEFRSAGLDVIARLGGAGCLRPRGGSKVLLTA